MPLPRSEDVRSRPHSGGSDLSQKLIHGVIAALLCALALFVAAKLIEAVLPVLIGMGIVLAAIYLFVARRQ